MGTCRAAARTVANPSDWPKCPLAKVPVLWGFGSLGGAGG